MDRPAGRGTVKNGLVLTTLAPNSAPQPPPGPVRLKTIVPAYPRDSTLAAFSVNVQMPRSTSAIYGPPVDGAFGGGAVLHARPTKIAVPETLPPVGKVAEPFCAARNSPPSLVPTLIREAPKSSSVVRRYWLLCTNSA